MCCVRGSSEGCCLCGVSLTGDGDCSGLVFGGGAGTMSAILIVIPTMGTADPN
jgi:hypothetical protein